tara:strand:+ start:5194 stop:5964 length:771 start_codon:yes stop_codon:yes gene_type:complete
LEPLSPIALGFLGSLAAGSLTAVGAVPVLFGRIPSRATRDLLLGFAAGVMLAASFFSLIIPALDAAEGQFDNGALPAAIVCVAILLGMGAIALMNERLPHEHFKTGREGPDAASLRRVWLFIIAITIHNFPEGLAVGVGFGADGLSGGLPLAIGIGLQNAPEGLAVAVSLLGEGLGHRRSDRSRRARRWTSRRRDYQSFATAAALGSRLRSRCDALRHQPRDHSGNPPIRPSEQGDARPRRWSCDHVVPRRLAGIS